jgi:cytochrome c
MPVRLVHSSTAREVSSVPLSLTIIVGRPRRAITASSSRTTRRPPIELSTTRASASRVKSSTIAGTRNRRPQDSTAREPRMKALSSYMRWLLTGVPDGAHLVGAGTLQIKEPGRAADPGRGAPVYCHVCAACHGTDGLGQRADAGAGYWFPPLWGPDSFNNGAGMSRLNHSGHTVLRCRSLPHQPDTAREGEPRQ